MSSLSNGQFNYNRFDGKSNDDVLANAYRAIYEKKADKDYDGDGKVESGSQEYLGSRDKAIKKAMGKSVKEGEEKKDLPPFMKDKKEDKKDKDCTCKEWVEDLVQQGYDLSEYTMEDMESMFEGMHREVDTGKVVKKAEVGKTYYPNQPKKKTSVKAMKTDPFGGRFKKEEVCQYLVDEGFTNNLVSAEVLFNHMSQEWMDHIEEAYKTMSAKATNMSKDRSASLADQEYKAAGSGDSAKTNQIMQKKIKVMDARNRHGKPGMR